MRIDAQYLKHLMDAAIEQAEIAFEKSEVPIGAVVANNEKIIARAHNEVESLHDPTAHAETLAIRRAAVATSNWRLNNHIVVSTIEPCTMCCGAIKLARAAIVVYGAADERAGAFGSLYDLSIEDRSGLVPRVISGIESARCLDLLRRFFREKEVDSATNGFLEECSLN